MNAADVTSSPRGPALLAKAGVSLSDAIWFYRQSRSGSAMDAGRLEKVCRKVQSILADSAQPVRARTAFA